MTLTLPRRFLPFLFALAVSIALALSARQLLRENPHSFGAAFTALFAIVLALVALWWALRQARYVLRPESLHLDRHGLHIRHHAVAGRTLHLRPADILDLKHNGATLSLDWRDNETTRHAILRLHRACYSDVSGKTRRGEAAVALLVARRHGATKAQIALAWVLAQQPWIVPIPGTTKQHRLEENLTAANTALTAADLGELDNALRRVKIVGHRYTAASQRMVNR